jgi:hypothetical protein
MGQASIYCAIAPHFVRSQSRKVIPQGVDERRGLDGGGWGCQVGLLPLPGKSTELGVVSRHLHRQLHFHLYGLLLPAWCRRPCGRDPRGAPGLRHIVLAKQDVTRPDQSGVSVYIRIKTYVLGVSGNTNHRCHCADTNTSNTSQVEGGRDHLPVIQDPELRFRSGFTARNGRTTTTTLSSAGAFC